VTLQVFCLFAGLDYAAEGGGGEEEGSAALPA